tara:strand:- start:379 stop:654 length:276 start_codon:yes stop_codon:yes gene_type:complete
MKKIISFILLFLFSSSVFAGVPAISADSTQASNAIEYNYSDISGVAVYDNSELSEIQGDGWFKVVFFIVRIAYAVTYGASEIDAPQKDSNE